MGKEGDSNRVYYHDLEWIDSSFPDFLSNYNELQSDYELSIHSRVHPPGPVFVYFLYSGSFEVLNVVEF